MEARSEGDDFVGTCEREGCGGEVRVGNALARERQIGVEAMYGTCSKCATVYVLTLDAEEFQPLES